MSWLHFSSGFWVIKTLDPDPASTNPDSKPLPITKKALILSKKKTKPTGVHAVAPLSFVGHQNPGSGLNESGSETLTNNKELQFCLENKPTWVHVVAPLSLRVPAHIAVPSWTHNNIKFVKKNKLTIVELIAFTSAYTSDESGLRCIMCGTGSVCNQQLVSYGT